jgi:hypothetical protein
MAAAAVFNIPMTTSVPFSITTSGMKGIHKWKPFTRRPVGRPKPRWEDDIRNDLEKDETYKMGRTSPRSP